MIMVFLSDRVVRCGPDHSNAWRLAIPTLSVSGVDLMENNNNNATCLHCKKWNVILTHFCMDRVIIVTTLLL